MIVVRIQGGLGNQMLQYALYLSLKKHYPDRKVVADITWFNYFSAHNGFQLEKVFPIHLDIFLGTRPKESTIFSVVRKYWYATLSKASVAFFKMGLFNKFEYIPDSEVFNERLFNLPLNKIHYLEGTWGNQRYFENIQPLLAEQLAFKDPLDPANEKLRYNIESGNSVSVHIRRGDYLHVNSEFVDLCKNDYYERALNHFQTNSKDPVFFIFSDDADWCKENLSWLQKYTHYFVEGNTKDNSYKDMQLMTLCKHNIIANSTFSWWGAWLNKNPDKIVVCPEQLFIDPEKNKKTLNEFYPSWWTRI